jgi:hypothetical protein
MCGSISPWSTKACNRVVIIVVVVVEEAAVVQYITGCSRSSLARVTVNGESAAQGPYYLNQHRMKIGLETG